MSKLTSLIGAAMDDAGRAEGLLRDSAARRALRDDPERILRTFELRRDATVDAAAARIFRAERRDVAVRAVHQLRQAGRSS